MAFLGCSRGLGKEVVLAAHSRASDLSSLLVSRNQDLLEGLRSQLSGDSCVFSCDLANADQLPGLLEKIKNLQCSRVFYFAAGGPYGYFQDKNWKDHQWALQVTLLTPAFLLHKFLQNPEFQFVKQFIAIGSQIADDKPDPMASGYAAAKHGLRGLVESIQAENCEFDLRLYRPGYMDTSMLPKNAAPRKSGKVVDPKIVAQDFLAWALDPSGDPIKSI